MNGRVGGAREGVADEVGRKQISETMMRRPTTGGRNLKASYEEQSQVASQSVGDDNEQRLVRVVSHKSRRCNVIQLTIVNLIQRIDTLTALLSDTKIL